MADCKIIFLDVDGTITNYENNVPPSAVRAIRLTRARGHRVYMCTDRSKAENPPGIWAIGFDGMIGGNGSYVEDAGEVVMHQLITFDQCKRIVDWLHGRGLEFYLESSNGLFASERFQEAARPILRQYKLGKGGYARGGRWARGRRRPSRHRVWCRALPRRPQQSEFHFVELSGPS